MMLIGYSNYYNAGSASSYCPVLLVHSKYLLHYMLSIPKFLPAPILPMSARSLEKNSSIFWNSLCPTAHSALVRNSINNYRV